MTVLLITHKSKPSVRFSGFRVLFSPDVCKVSLYFSLCSPFWGSFFAVVTDTAQYFALLSSAQKTGRIKVFSTNSCLHKRFNGVYTYYDSSVTANTLTILYTGRPFLLTKLFTDLSRLVPTKIIVAIHKHKKKLTSVQCILNGIYWLIAINARRLTSPGNSTAKVKAKFKSTQNCLTYVQNKTDS